MKKFMLVGIILLAAFLSLSLESVGKTIADIYTQSYAAQMRNQMGGQSAAEIRAEEYQASYERCSEHHDCSNATVPLKPAAKAGKKGSSGTVNPFLLLPAWQ